MKHNLGKRSLHLFFLLLSFLTLHAEDFTYTFKVDQPTPYVKEPVILTLDLNQTNHDVVMLFSFDIKKSEDYTFQRLDIRKTENYHDAKIHYVYLIYPLRSGELDITFDLIKKVTTDESLAYSFSGDRDNVKKLVTKDTQIDLPPVQLRVKPLPEGTLLVGDFTLSYEIKKHQAKAYEPLPFQVSIKGKGYPPLVGTLLPKEGNFTRFTEKPIVKSVATKEGTHSTVTYPMALSHSQSFSLSPIRLNAFDPKSEKKYTLDIPSQQFDIEQVESRHLVDTVDAPDIASEDWSWLSTLLGYTITFFAGYMTALSWRWSMKKRQKENHPLVQKIRNCKDEKSLLQVLIAADHSDFTSSIEKLEDSLYGNGKINFNKVKQDALEKRI
ncbi:hypothetical protein MN086_10750 [Sulfurovum sp. XGS-02]|uniref:hypothetical protein n=1 Tax=Sulfurovum sp. XGS-02 TaxID=2925411 RepID=UPI0020698DCD|nr:hypothetical protein [Sulfurovum sp. XGS-02]UPT77511.1 hypothetical protein MN086_10750 [Sulfurovum sp. XGS-02]